ncbi:sensor domain-containing protein [Streptomyces poonensis]|uniref:Lipoprotein n=1 Tax=Streptomyces poonensis TaxID=68255 RepID=A0A918UDN2_9ACTN|nr:sensor domain-containing protein [Streptomyces poonensis]GGY92931.1 lipoprotein [Streptomyces poonensis]GLJ87622.1 lipoprotein [Streptomyces poonensis]
MRSTAVRRVGLAASAATLALLATACGGSDDGDKGTDAKDSTASASASAAPAAKALTAAELEKAALAQADVDNGEVDTKISGSADDVTKDKVKSEDAACAPLALAQSGAAQGDPAATVKRMWTEKGEEISDDEAMTEEAMLASLDVEMVFVTLASYEEGGAEKVVKDTEAAVQKCAGGFTYTAAGEKAETVKVTGTEAPKGADEAVAMNMSVTADSEEMPFKIVVARKGSTIVSVGAMNLASAVTGKDFEFPTQILDTQLKKLG